MTQKEKMKKNGGKALINLDWYIDIYNIWRSPFDEKPLLSFKLPTRLEIRFDFSVLKQT